MVVCRPMAGRPNIVRGRLLPRRRCCCCPTCRFSSSAGRLPATDRGICDVSQGRCTGVRLEFGLIFYPNGWRRTVMGWGFAAFAAAMKTVVKKCNPCRDAAPKTTRRPQAHARISSNRAAALWHLQQQQQPGNSTIIKLLLRCKQHGSCCRDAAKIDQTRRFTLTRRRRVVAGCQSSLHELMPD